MSPPDHSKAAAEIPYPGLDPYTESSAAPFCGRDDDIRLVAANALTNRVTLFYGESGVGKTSVLRAGVIRNLQERAIKDATAKVLQFIPAYCETWQSEPRGKLLAAVSRAAEAITGHTPSPAGENLAETLRRWSKELDVDLVIVLDQFEELFLYATPDHARFCDELAQLLGSRTGSVNVLISMREDSLARLDAFKDRIPGLFANRVRLEHLSRKGAEDAIRRPLASFRLPDGRQIGIKDDLVEALLDEPELHAGRLFYTATQAGAQAGEERYETSLLQLVLVGLCNAEVDAAKPPAVPEMRLDTYSNKLKGARNIIKSHLDKALNHLSAERQKLFAEASRFLVTRSRQKYAWRISDLAVELKVQPSPLEELFNTLAQRPYRVLRGGDGAGSYQIFHDVLADPILTWRARYDADRAIEKKLEVERTTRLKIITAVLGTLVIALGWATYQAFSLAGAAKDAELRARASLKEARKATGRATEAAAHAKTAQEQAEAASNSASTAAALAIQREGEATRNATEATKAKLLVEQEKEQAKKSYEEIFGKQSAAFADTSLKVTALLEAVERIKPGTPITAEQKNVVLALLHDTAKIVQGYENDAGKKAESFKEATAAALPEVLPQAPYAGPIWVYVGRLDQTKSAEHAWSDRVFDNLSSADPLDEPEENQVLKALSFVNVRKGANKYNNQTKTWSSEPIVDLIKPDDRLRVLSRVNVEGPAGDSWTRVWVSAERVDPSEVVTRAQEPQKRCWVELWDKPNFEGDKHKRFDEPFSASDLHAIMWPGGTDTVGNDTESLQTGPGAWFIGYRNKQFENPIIQVGPNQKLRAVTSRFKSFKLFDRKPVNWRDQPPRPR